MGWRPRAGDRFQARPLRVRRLRWLLPIAPPQVRAGDVARQRAPPELGFRIPGRPAALPPPTRPPVLVHSGREIGDGRGYCSRRKANTSLPSAGTRSWVFPARRRYRHAPNIQRGVAPDVDLLDPGRLHLLEHRLGGGLDDPGHPRSNMRRRS